MKKLLLLSTIMAMSACSSPETEVKTVEKEAEKVVKQAATEPAEKAVEDKPAYTLAQTDLGQGVYMLVGRGGNIGVLTGEDGVFVVDDQFANLAADIIAHIDGMSDGSIRFVANTHYHGDHTGGNQAMRATGASVVAHHNVHTRMSEDQENLLWGRTTPAADPASWPTITFNDNMTFHFSGQTIQVIHVPTAHTDGDSIIYFEEADVLHMGDNFFNGLFPYIDIDAGGTVDGMLAALDEGLLLAGPDTKIIPGHGPLSTEADMQATRDLLADVQLRVKTRIDAGDNLEQILKAGILSDYSNYASFIDEDNMVRIAYRSLTGRLE